MSGSALSRFVVGLDGGSLRADERRRFAGAPPFGFLLLPRNLVSAEQTAGLLAELKGLGEPVPLLFVDQEGGPVDRLGPLLGVPFPSAARCAERGSDAVHEAAYLMGRSARLLGFDVDLAPVLDLAQPGTGAVHLAGRCYGFHPEDVVVAGMMFVNGLSRAGVASCLKHFPGLGRAGADAHRELPVVDAHDVDLMVTDVHPFARLARSADLVMVGHAAYPGITGDVTPASLSPRIVELLRRTLAFDGAVVSDDLRMEALQGPLAGRAAAADEAGCDLLLVSRPGDDLEAAAERVAASAVDAARDERLARLRRRCEAAPRSRFDAEAWERVAADAAAFVAALDAPRPSRSPDPDEL